LDEVPCGTPSVEGQSKIEEDVGFPRRCHVGSEVKGREGASKALTPLVKKLNKREKNKEEEKRVKSLVIMI